MTTGYPAVIQQDGDWWIGWVEEVAGVNSQGTTREELLNNLRDALEETLEMNRQEARAAASGAFEEVILVPGAAIVAGHPSWAWPGAILTGFGWLLVLKGFVSFLVPDKALRSMDRDGRSASEFVFAGVLLVAIGAWACYCLWHREAL